MIYEILGHLSTIEYKLLQYSKVDEKVMTIQLHLRRALNEKKYKWSFMVEI